MTVDAALLEKVVPEVPVLLSLLITATLIGLQMTSIVTCKDYFYTCG